MCVGVCVCVEVCVCVCGLVLCVRSVDSNWFLAELMCQLRWVAGVVVVWVILVCFCTCPVGCAIGVLCEFGD